MHQRIAVIGSGSLGKAYGGLLANAGHEVHFLMRSEYESIQSSQYFQLNLLETNTIVKINNPHIHKECKSIPECDLTILSIKTTSNKDIPKLLSPSSKSIFVLQNGIGNEEYIAQFTDASLVCGISMMGSIRKNDLEVNVPLLGFLRIAPYKIEHTPAAENIQSLFTDINIPTELFTNHRELRWRKLLWNVPFGALSLIHNQSTDVLARDYLEEVYKLIRELQAIAEVEGIYTSEEFIELMLQRTRDEAKGYLPSIYIDHKAGRPMETEYLFYNVLKIAKEKGVKTPFLEEVILKLKSF